MVKLSLFLLYFRIFSRNTRIKFALYFGIVTITIFYTINFGLFLYFCNSKSGQNLRSGFNSAHYLSDARTAVMVQACFGIGSDVYLLCIPIFIISKLQLSTKKKIGCLAIFMTGSLLVNTSDWNKIIRTDWFFSAVICGILNLHYRIIEKLTSDVAWKTPAVDITRCVIYRAAMKRNAKSVLARWKPM